MPYCCMNDLISPSNAAYFAGPAAPVIVNPLAFAVGEADGAGVGVAVAEPVGVAVGVAVG